MPADEKNQGRSEHIQTVITIHGINSDGAWQDSIKAVLEPHFHCVSVRYLQYRRFGAIKLFSDLRVIIPGAMLLGLLVAGGLLTPVHALVWFLVVVAAGYPLAIRRLRAAREDVRRQLDETQKVGGCPHVIAHSLGSYLFGSVLRIWQETRFEHIILAGCVLSKKFDWEGHLHDNPSSFVSVRNEIARKDVIARAAAFLQGLVPNLGHAGFAGFKGSESFIHTRRSPNLPCEMCETTHSTAVIHNVVHRELGHSDHFIGPSRAESFWLPVLWGIEPYEYQEFLRICADIQNAENNREPIDGQVEILKCKTWSWTRGSPLATYMESKIQEILRKDGIDPGMANVEALVHDAALQLWRNVERARHARRAGTRDRKLVASLYPRWAIALAIESALKTVRKWKKRSSYR